jgi:hypothetical protein
LGDAPSGAWQFVTPLSGKRTEIPRGPRSVLSRPLGFEEGVSRVMNRAVFEPATAIPPCVAASFMCDGISRCRTYEFPDSKSRFLRTGCADIANVDHSQIGTVVPGDNRVHIGGQSGIARQIDLQPVCECDDESTGKSNASPAGERLVLSGSARNPPDKSFACIAVTIAT